MPGPVSLPALSDGVVELRPFDASDAPALIEIWRDPTIRANNTVPEPTEHAALDWIAVSAAKTAAGEQWEWAVVDSASGDLAGRRAVKAINWERRCGHAACWIAPQFRGRQFAPRSLRLAAPHTFAGGLVRIQGACETSNASSYRSMTRAGMTYEGRARSYWVVPEGTLDADMFSLIPQDFGLVFAHGAASPTPQLPVAP